jgi:hypothetical protein
MQIDPHERARLLLDRALLESISPDERGWLDRHTAECPGCSGYRATSERALRALDSFAFDLDPVAALRVENAIRSHCLTAPAESHGRRFLIGTAAAMFLTITGSVAMWQPAAWLAVRWSLPAPAWQIGFGIFWLLPSLLIGVVPLFRSKLMGDRPWRLDSSSEGETI